MSLSLPASEVSRGMVLCHADRETLSTCHSFVGQCRIMAGASRKKGIAKGFRPFVFATTATFACHVDAVLRIVDKNGVTLQENPDCAKPGDIALIRFVLDEGKVAVLEEFPSPLGS